MSVSSSSKSAEKHLTHPKKSIVNIRRGVGTKHLSLIQAIMLLHDRKHLKQRRKYESEHVRPFKVTDENVCLANKLAHQILGRKLRNLPFKSRLLFLLIQEFVGRFCEAQKIDQVDCYLSYEIIKEYTGWGSSDFKLHLHRLEEMRYIYQEGRGAFKLYKLAVKRQASTTIRKSRIVDRFLKQ